MSTRCTDSVVPQNTLPTPATSVHPSRSHRALASRKSKCVRLASWASRRSMGDRRSSGPSPSIHQMNSGASPMDGEKTASLCSANSGSLGKIRVSTKTEPLISCPPTASAAGGATPPPNTAISAHIRARVHGVFMSTAPYLPRRRRDGVNSPSVSPLSNVHSLNTRSVLLPFWWFSIAMRLGRQYWPRYCS